jgi:MYXO-CTERM domain-containing protein
MLRAARNRPGWRSGDAVIGWALRILTAAALIIDAVVHLQDAYFYDANAGALLSQGELFRIQAGVAVAVALVVLAWPRWPAWVLAFLVTVSAVSAVVAYTYLNIGPFAGLPSMYEPSWGPPGKLPSAFAEGAGALLALAGLGWAAARRRRQRA